MLITDLLFSFLQLSTTPVSGTLTIQNSFLGLLKNVNKTVNELMGVHGN